ncbi:lipid A biosynthesis acyltransferase [Candidatus Methylocalor cossyra]|uniref:Acyltransferase n=1 Tax=Candidatus Methylocalor cossyra TaxID=3108543 RepID=A0ABP1C6Y5_9GAMM
MSERWLELPERSSTFWLNTILWIALRLGRCTARLLLYPITAYFLVFSRQTRAASRAFLRRALGRECGWPEVFRHYHTFASTLLDRVYVFVGQDRHLDFRVHGLEVLERYGCAGQGCLLVGAHLGSFEILRALGRIRAGLRIKALVHGESTPRIAGLFRKLNPELFDDIVPVGVASSLLALREHAERGGMVALLGDRSLSSDKRVRCRFFGEPAWFPQAPALLAQILQLPMVAFFCLRRGEARYEVWFELLAAPEAESQGPRPGRVVELMQRYAERLEHYCRLAPYNWFNFYDFWHGEG